jgi:hypothetical protein
MPGNVTFDAIGGKLRAGGAGLRPFASPAGYSSGLRASLESRPSLWDCESSGGEGYLWLR